MSEFTYDQHPPDRDFGPTVLIVDDEKVQRERMVEICSETKKAEYLRVLSCPSLAEALNIVASDSVDVVLLDKNLTTDENDETPAANGIEAIPQFLKINKNLQILVVTASRKIPDAVKAIRYGALNYVTKESPDELILAQVNKAIEVARITKENTLLNRGGKHTVQIDIPGNSKVVRRLKTQLQAVAESNRPVLLLGENGTGKTTAAMMTHEMRAQFLKQKGRPFLEINCGALAPSLIEKELFGNEAGAYTDAKEARPGFFELANNGTLFLDEIAELSLDLQVKLLKVLQSGRFNRLGSTKERHSSFKLICATNRDIEKMVAEKTFREDLYMRLAVLVVRVPSLEQRKEDIPDIVKALLPSACKENHVNIEFKEIPKDFLDFLKDTPIKGNLRGVEHILTRLLIHSPKDKDGRPLLKQWQSVSELGFDGKVSDDPKMETVTLEMILHSRFDIVKAGFPGFKKVVKLFRDRLITEAKQKYGNDADVARALQISQATVNVELKRLKGISSSNGTTPHHEEEVVQ